MKKFLLISRASIAALIVFIGTTAFAQQPEQIDIQSLKIVHVGFESEGTIIYRNSSHSLMTFRGWANYRLPFMNAVSSLPNTLTSNGFGNFSLITSSSGGGGDYRFQFYLTSSESTPIILRPTILRKKRVITVNGATAIAGRVEVIDQRTLPHRVIAVDNDFELKGNFQVEFTQNHAATQRSVTYQGITYNLVQTQ